jgi:hypothetical protein
LCARTQHAGQQRTNWTRLSNNRCPTVCRSRDPGGFHWSPRSTSPNLRSLSSRSGKPDRTLYCAPRKRGGRGAGAVRGEALRELARPSRSFHSNALGKCRPNTHLAKLQLPRHGGINLVDNAKALEEDHWPTVVGNTASDVVNLRRRALWPWEPTEPKKLMANKCLHRPR